MPKLKTHKTTVKRMKRSGAGLLITRKMSVAHRARFKSSRALQNSKKTQTVSKALAKKLVKII